MEKPGYMLEVFDGSDYKDVIGEIAQQYQVAAEDLPLRDILAISLLSVLQVTGVLRGDGVFDIPKNINPELQGKTLADIGCGREEPYRDLVAHPRRYQPWLARTAAHLGMNVTGIDQASPPKVEAKIGGSWNYIQTDLKRRNPWAIATASQDAVAIVGLVHATHHDEIAPEILGEITRAPFSEYSRCFRPHLLTEARRTLKPNTGRLLLNNLCYRATPEQWVPSNLLTRKLLNLHGLTGVQPEQMPLSNNS